MLGKTLYAASPFAFLVFAAVPVPDHWDFAFYSFLGAFAGACARVGVALYAGTVGTALKSAALTFASFWLGMIGPLAAYAVGEVPGYGRLLDGSDPIKIMAFAGLSALFGVVLEMLGARWIRKRAKALDKDKETNE